MTEMKEYLVDKTHSPGRKPAKPEYSAEKNLTNQMDAAAALYKNNMSLQAIAEELSEHIFPKIFEICCEI